MAYILREATRADAIRIAPLLREKDKLEVEVVSGKTPEAALLSAFNAAGVTAFAETADHHPIMLAGVQRTHPKAGAIWMVGTSLLEHYALPSVRSSRRWIEQQHKTYPLLWNQALENNDLHVRWLKLLGFSFLRRVPHRGHTFIEFARIKTCAEHPQ